MRNKDVLFLALFGAGAFAVYYLFKKGAGVVTSVTNPLAAGIANVYTALTLPPGIQVTGSVVLPDGSTTIPLQNLPGLVPDAAGNVFFTYNGLRYQIVQGFDANGNRLTVSA